MRWKKILYSIVGTLSELKDDSRYLPIAERMESSTYMDHGIYGIDLKSLACGTCPDLQKSSSRSARPFPGGMAGEYRDLGFTDDPDHGPRHRGQDSGGRTEWFCNGILGFVGNDCIYGTGDSGDYLMSNGRVMGTYLNSIDIVDREMKSVMHYEKPGSWIREVSVDDSRIHMDM